MILEICCFTVIRVTKMVPECVVISHYYSYTKHMSEVKFTGKKSHSIHLFERRVETETHGYPEWSASQNSHLPAKNNLRVVLQDFWALGVSFKAKCYVLYQVVTHTLSTRPTVNPWDRAWPVLAAQHTPPHIPMVPTSPHYSSAIAPMLSATHLHIQSHAVLFGSDGRA